MTMPPEPAASAARDPRATRAPHADSYMDWPAALAGAALAYALFMVLSTFGAGIGLSMVSADPQEGISLRWFTIAAGIWFVWVTISSFAAGGYLAGRMRRPVGDATEDEVETRDGAHGVVVWAAASVLAMVLAASGVTNMIGGLASGVGSATGSVAEAMEGPLDYFAGVAMRTEGGEVAGDPEARSEIAAVLARSLSQGEVSEEDRAYIASVVASATDTEREAARAQVDTAITEAQAAWDEAAEAAEQARIAAAIGAFVLAATMLVSAAAAYFAATTGGQHRDQNLGFRTFGR